MVIIKNPNDYEFVKFIKSNSKNKKYDAILKNKKTNRFKTVPFGDKRYQHYKDTALGIYSNLNHLDKKRRRSFRNRHYNNSKNKFSSGYFSYYYLW